MKFDEAFGRITLSQLKFKRIEPSEWSIERDARNSSSLTKEVSVYYYNVS